MILFTYLISKDIIETLERKFKFSLDSKLTQEIKELENRFIEEFQSYIPQNVRYTCVNAETVSKQILDELSKIKLPIISLDRVYAPEADGFLELTRLTNQYNGTSKISERPGFPSIKEQISQIKKYNQIALVDVGAFEGKTIFDICDMLNNENVTVEQVILGVSSKEANERISSKISVSALNLFNFYEWIELRDLFGIDGRNVRFSQKRREFMPYWENLNKWASILPTIEDDVKNICKEFNSKLVGMLWQEGYDLNKIGRPVKYLGEK